MDMFVGMGMVVLSSIMGMWALVEGKSPEERAPAPVKSKRQRAPFKGERHGITRVSPALLNGQSAQHQCYLKEKTTQLY